MIDTDQLIQESEGDLTLLERKKHGYLVFHNKHHKQNYVFIPEKIEEMSERINNGWIKYGGRSRYVLRAPEAVLSDLTEINQNPTKDLVEIASLFDFLKSEDMNSILANIGKNQRYIGLDITEIHGECSDLEIRVAGIDNRIMEIPKVVYSIVKNSNMWYDYVSKYKEVINNRMTNVSSTDLSRTGKESNVFFQKLDELYRTIGISLPAQPVVKGFWHDLPWCDGYMFVPKAGLKYALGFIEETLRIDNVTLWEYHHGMNDDKELIVIKGDFDKKR